MGSAADSDHTDAVPAASDPGRDRAAALVDLAAYPLLAPDSPAGAAAIRQHAGAFASTGSAELSGFLTPEGLEACRRDALALAPRAHWSRGSSGPYLEIPDPGWPEGHPRRHLEPFAVGAVAYDLFPPESPLRALYEWEPLREWIGCIVGRRPLFRYADPLGALNVAVMGDGDCLEWHFDQTDFVVSLALQDAERGGAFEVVPGIRSEDEECYDEVARVLAGDERRIVGLPFDPGTLLVFAGRHSMHRVTAISGSAFRLVALLGFDTVPGTRSSELLQRVRYGRVA